MLQGLKLRRSPSVPTLGRVLRKVSVAEVRAALRTFARQLLEVRNLEKEVTVAADGKSCRGVWEEGRQMGLVHLFAREAQVALDRELTPYHAGEAKAAQRRIEEKAAHFPGLAVLTGDALLADRSLCAAILEQGGDYVVKLKNQPALYQDVEALFAEGGEPELAVTNKGHGRLERREVRTSGELEGYSDFPGLKQAVEVKKTVAGLKTGEVSESIRYGITGLCAEQAGAARLLKLMRGHWGIENGLFHVKDDSFGEDRQVLHNHQSGTVVSLLREPQLSTC